MEPASIAGGWRAPPLQFDSDNKPFKAVGVIVDIDSQKAEASLEDRAARDELTGLYNKVSAGRIEAHLFASALPMTCRP